MAFGDLTYPYRYGQPSSSVVDYNPNPADWATDYQSRYDAQSQPKPFDYNTVLYPFGQRTNPMPAGSWGGRAMERYARSPLDELIDSYTRNTGVTDPAELQRVRDYAVAAYKDPNGDPLSAQGMNLTPEQEAAIGGVTNNRDFASSLFGFDNGTYPGARSGPGFDTSAFGPGATFQTPGPQTFDDFMKNGSLSDQFWMQSADKRAADALTNEKNLMVPKLTAATRAEQGFQQMNGWGQTNGIMSADYSTPGFGQINGDFGQADLGANGGVRPTLPAGSMANTIWGAAPQRTMPWML